MKKYLAFYGQYYYPNGGISDLIGSFDTPEDCKTAIIAAHKDEEYAADEWQDSWCHIYDTETGEVVFRINKN